jgi:hypothetical protein
MEVNVAGEWRTVTDITQNHISHRKEDQNIIICGGIKVHNTPLRFKNPEGQWVYFKLERGL